MRRSCLRSQCSGASWRAHSQGTRTIVVHEARCRSRGGHRQSDVRPRAASRSHRAITILRGQGNDDVAGRPLHFLNRLIPTTRPRSGSWQTVQAHVRILAVLGRTPACRSLKRDSVVRGRDDSLMWVVAGQWRSRRLLAVRPLACCETRKAAGQRPGPAYQMRITPSNFLLRWYRTVAGGPTPRWREVLRSAG